MDFTSKNIPLIVYKNPINMHRSFNGLLTLVFSELNLDLQKDVYVLFMNRDRNQFKILFLHHGHVSIFTMRLAGSLRADFTKMDLINSWSLYKLIENVVSRNHRLRKILD